MEGAASGEQFLASHTPVEEEIDTGNGDDENFDEDEDEAGKQKHRLLVAEIVAARGQYIQ